MTFIPPSSKEISPVHNGIVVIRPFESKEVGIGIPFIYYFDDFKVGDGLHVPKVYSNILQTTNGRNPVLVGESQLDGEKYQLGSSHHFPGFIW